jgi:Domain of unknown function (DUF4032)/Lipopolysaccharide kinase (Kdo/WaaP) family
MTGGPGLLEIQVRAGHPDFLELPWQAPLREWPNLTERVVEMPRGLSRHEVVFLGYPEAVYAFKELPAGLAERESDTLRGLEERGLPAVTAVGHARVALEDGEGSVLITRFAEGALPYRTLFMQHGLERYRERLLDAMAILLVRMHLGGLFWGDCSLSNTLFRRDAGELFAFLVDAETSGLYPSVSDGQRAQDLAILEENIAGELADLSAIAELPPALDVWETGEQIRQRYEGLWHEIGVELSIAPDERYRIHERIRALEGLGFSVAEVQLTPVAGRSQVRMRAIVTDRDYHRKTLHGLTGISASDRQATLMLNEIAEMRATMHRDGAPSVPMSLAAYRWLTERWQVAMERLAPEREAGADLAELYCQVLEHKWLLSERAGRDVGLGAAIDDYRARILEDPLLPSTD